jgi:hypothetical protein
VNEELAREMLRLRAIVARKGRTCGRPPHGAGSGDSIRGTGAVEARVDALFARASEGSGWGRGWSRGRLVRSEESSKSNDVWARKTSGASRSTTTRPRAPMGRQVDRRHRND